jgi:formate C-acetyltransferase
MKDNCQIQPTYEKLINVRDFIYKNITPYNGDSFFLVGPSQKTKKLWTECKKLLKKETNNGGVLDIDTKTISSIISHKPGYINKSLEIIVGLQTDEPLKRAIKPAGGIRAVTHACEENNKEVDKNVIEIFTKYRRTHNDGVFSAYTEEMRKLRKTGVLTGLPDAYARGRIIGDYRRVALYGIDQLIENKKEDKKQLDGTMTDEKIKLL